MAPSPAKRISSSTPPEPPLLDIFPTDLSLNHLQRTWLYWLLLVLLMIELFWMRPRTLRFIQSLHPIGPWDQTRGIAPLTIFSLKASLWISGALILALALASAAAFYITLLLFPMALARFVAEIRLASGGEAIGGAIGSWLGASLQALLIVGAVATIDPTSTFPLRLDSHLNESASS